MHTFLVLMAALLLPSAFGCEQTDQSRTKSAAISANLDTDIMVQRAAKQRRVELNSRLQPRVISARPRSSESASLSGETVIRSVSNDYAVPAGLLNGIWHKESVGLTRGWSYGKWWPSASTMTAAGSACVREYGRAFCYRQWRAIVAICGQRRVGGQPVCDPYAIRVSKAGAMGPMQHLPTSLTNEDGTGFSWARHAVDYDHDGVFDPHALPDAMAATALLLRRLYAKHGSWQRAANAYLGSQSRGYFEGTTSGRRGVVDYWQRWCEKTRDCL